MGTRTAVTGDDRTSDLEARPPSQGTVLGSRTRINVIRLAILVAFLLLWEYASGRLIAPFFVSSPSAVAAHELAYSRLMRQAQSSPGQISVSGSPSPDTPVRAA